MKKKNLQDFADIIVSLADSVRKRKPIKFFVYIEENEDMVYSVPYSLVPREPGVSDEAYQDLVLSEQVEMMYRLARHLDNIPLYQIAQERIDIEDSGEIQNLITFH